MHYEWAPDEVNARRPELPPQISAQRAVDRFFVSADYIGAIAKAAAKQISARVSIAALVVAKLTGSKTRSWAIPLSGAVPALSTVTLQVQPHCRFRVKHIHNAGDTDSLLVVGAFVGQRVQMPTLTEGIPVAVLDKLTSQQWDECDPTLFITLQIKNTSKEQRYFSCVLDGEAIL